MKLAKIILSLITVSLLSMGFSMGANAQDDVKVLEEVLIVGAVKSQISESEPTQGVNEPAILPVIAE